MAKIARIDDCIYCSEKLACPHKKRLLTHNIPGKDCPLPDADEYDRALIVRGMRLLWKRIEFAAVMTDRELKEMLLEVRDGKQG